MKVCNKCVLDERFPGIKFDEAGTCNFCLNMTDARQRQCMKDKYESRFRQLIQQHKRRGGYDCLVAYSGGKDSTYTLHLLKETYGLKFLAYSFDNWFQSEAARRNIRTVLSKIKADHWTITPSFETMKNVVLASVSKNTYSKKALSRASSICTSCISLIRFIGLRIAIEENIPFLVFGMSPGQSPIAASLVKTSSSMIRYMQENLLRGLFDRLGDSISQLILEERHFSMGDFPYIVNPLAFVEYNEDKIYKVVKNYGWIKPKDTDANSTNCLLNAFANKVHLKQFGYNPYAYEIAELVRAGQLEREEGLSRLKQPMKTAQIRAIKKRLGIK